jgi:hypothetical protein
MWWKEEIRGIACQASGRDFPGLRALKSRLATAQLEILQAHSVNMAQSDEEDDYMNMVFEDAPKGPKYETSLQRAARKRKEVRLFATGKATQS